LKTFREKLNAATESYNHAVKYLSDGREEEALVLFEEIINKWPEVAPAHLQLGIIYRERGHIQAAILAFKNAVKHAPKWELASLNLFHILNKNGQGKSAFDELRRYLAVAESRDYREILEGLKSDLEESAGNYLEICDEPSQN
jgi:Tfp pilus assembly protein PilF